MEEEPLVHCHLGGENRGKVPPPPVIARREPTEKGGAYTKVSGSQGEASVLAEATSGRLQPDEWELLPPPPPLGRGAHPELEEQARQTQGMEERGSQDGEWEAAKEDRDQCPPRGGPGHTKGKSPLPPPEEAALALKEVLATKTPTAAKVTSTASIQGGLRERRLPTRRLGRSRGPIERPVPTQAEGDTRDDAGRRGARV